ncbi:WD40 repeat domain-containing protein [Flocculibacter collagenilyticus]|uniref:WD40 repeat domain-containing protein n=1 Tax=Flocculibacter collagenilyticus TaxID=2744479 RepID=UPI0018F40F39|nr:hypothetical protein [Flocculibacter collagenilyticus]
MHRLFSTFIYIIALFGLSQTVGCAPIASDADASIEHAVEGSYSGYLSYDGKYSIVSSIHHGLALWDNQSNALKYQWKHNDDAENLVLASHISHNNSHALTADSETFVLWNIETGDAEGYWKVKDSKVRDVAVSNDGKHLLIGKSSGVVVHINLASARRLEFLGHQQKINSVDMSPNGRYALTASNDYVAYLWDTKSGQVIYRFNHPSRVTKVALDPQGRYAFTADSKKKSVIWDLTNGEAISQLQYIQRQFIFSAVRFSEDGKWLATGSPSRHLTLWNIESGEAIAQWLVAPRKNTRPKSSVVYSVSFINNNKQLLTESSSGLAEVWSINQKIKG